MRKIILLSLLLTSFNCKPQTTKLTKLEKTKHIEMENEKFDSKLIDRNFEIFDIKNFYNNNIEGVGKTYELPNGNQIEEGAGDDGSWFLRNETQKNSIFTQYKLYYSTGNIKEKWKTFGNGCAIGLGFEFDNNGKIIKEIDFDKPFKLTVNDILKFLKKSNADFDRYFSVNRVYDENKKTGTWTLIFDGTYKSNQGKYLIEIDDKTNEIQYVAKITGKEGEKQILKNTKKEALLIDKDNSEKNNNLIVMGLIFLALLLIFGVLFYKFKTSQFQNP